MQAIAERGGTVLVALTEPTPELFDQTRAVVVNTRRGTVSEPGLVQNILARGYWTPFQGDPAPVLALVSAASAGGVQAAAYDESKHRRYPKGTSVKGKEGGGRFAPKAAEGGSDLVATPTWLKSEARSAEDAYYKATRPREAVDIARGWLAQNGFTAEAKGNAVQVVQAMEDHYPDGYEFFLSMNDMHKEDFRRNYKVGDTYQPERARLHAGIQAAYMAEGAVPEGQPEALFLAGGTGAGKSSLVEAAGLRPPGSVYINPDDIKEILPEAKALRARDDERWAALAHEESSDIASELRDQAQAAGFPMVIDGTGDAAPGKFLGKVKAAQDAGYKTKVVLVDIPTEEAIRRSDLRALQTGRKVNSEQIRDIHRSVTQRFTEWRDQVNDWEVWANDDAQQGGRRLIARRVNGGPVEVLDPARYAQMEAKAHA